MSIFKNIVEKFIDLKNSGLCGLATKYINKKIEEYGTMVNFQIDSKKKKIILELLLKGEKESMNIEIEKYEVINKGGSSYIKFKNVSASREWIEVLIHNVLIPNYTPTKMYEIDSSYAKIVDLLI